MSEGFNVTLASALLEFESTNKHEDIKRHGNDVSTSRTFFRTGIKSLDHNLIPFSWLGGKAIGLGTLPSEAKAAHVQRDKSLAVEFISTHLIDEYERCKTIPQANEPTEKKPCVFVVTPASSSTISNIFNTILARLRRELKPTLRTATVPSKRSISTYVGTTKTPNTNAHNADIPGIQDQSETVTHHEKDIESKAMSILEAASVLQYLDLVGLTESLSEISSSLDEQDQDRRQQHQHQHRAKNVIVYVEGLNQTISRLLRQMNVSSSTASSAAPIPSSTNAGGQTWRVPQTGAPSSALTARTMSKLSQSAAMLSHIMRQIRMITKPRPQLHLHQHLHGSDNEDDQCNQVLTLVEISVTLVPPGPSVSSSTNYRPDTQAQAHGHAHAHARSKSHGDRRNMLNTAFADPKGRVVRLQCTNSPTTTPFPTTYGRTSTTSLSYNNDKINTEPDKSQAMDASGPDLILNRIIANALDSIVIVHDGLTANDSSSSDDFSVVEVVRDTLTCDGDGCGTGCWAVWDHN